MRRGNGDPPLCSPCRHSDHLDQSSCCRLCAVYLKHIRYCSDCYKRLLLCIFRWSWLTIVTWSSSIPPRKKEKILNKDITTTFHLVQFTSQRSSYPSKILALKLQRALANFIWAWQSTDQILVAARFFTSSRLALGPHPASCTMGTGSLSLRYSGQGVVFTTHPHLVWKLKLYLYLSLGTLWTVTEWTLPLRSLTL